MASKGRLARQLMAITLVAMMSCAIFISVFATNNAEASFASFEKGDKFALKGEKGFSLGYYSANQLFKIGGDESWIRNGIVDNASVNAYMSSVMLFEVTDVTSDEYVMKVVTAQNLSLAVKLLVTGELVEPGKYITDWDYSSTNPENLLNISDADTAMGQAGIDARLVTGSNGTYIVHVQKSDMAIKSVAVDMSVYARGHLDLYNYPNSTSNYDFSHRIVTMNVSSYESMSSNVTLDLNLVGQMSFDPYLAMVKDGPDEDSTWNSDTYVNATFSWTGLLDMTGLPKSLADNLFDEELADMGITGFPIDLAKIYTPSSANPRIDNGTMTITAEEVFPEFSNLGNDVVNDPVYGNITIYRLGFNNATQTNNLEAWYYPAKGILVGIELNYPVTKTLTITLDMKSVPIKDAEKTLSNISEQVADKKTFEQVNAVVDAGGSTGGLSDLLLPIIGLIAVAVIAVVAIVFVVKRKNKPKA